MNTNGPLQTSFSRTYLAIGVGEGTLLVAKQYSCPAYARMPLNDEMEVEVIITCRFLQIVRFV